MNTLEKNQTFFVCLKASVINNLLDFILSTHKKRALTHWLTLP